MSKLLEQAQWIWADTVEKNAYVAFVKSFPCYESQSVSIDLFADTYYKLYVNGVFVNAGPAPFRKPVVMIDHYDISEYMKSGTNHICVLCHFVGKTIKWNTTDKPCIGAQIHLASTSIVTDESWSAYPIEAWQPQTPDMVWALGSIEALDCKHPSYEVLRHFATSDYGPSKIPLIVSAQKPKIVEQNISERRQRMVPYLRWEHIPCRAEPKIFKTSRETFNLNDHALRTGFEHRLEVWDADAVHMFQDDGVHLNRWRGERGFGLHYDFRRICAGEFSLEIDADSEATLDIGFTERVMDGIPEMTRSGSKFYMRVHLRAGHNKVRMYKFSGFRHLYITCKDFEGDLHIRPPVCHECHADLNYTGAFRTNDRTLNALYDISQRSVILNTQAQSYDCNSREQGCYWGDSIFILDLVGHMTGDFSQMRHLCYAMKDEYEAEGQINSSLFGLGTVLFDYCMVPMEVMRRYHRYTGDKQTIIDNLSCAEKIVDDFRQLKEANGLIALRNWRKTDSETIRHGILFLDHAGLGWHPRDSVGIDRDDYNAGMNLFYLQALQALDELHFVLDRPRQFEQEIQSHSALIRKTFFDPAVGLLIDAVDTGKSDKHYSQIVNALGISLGVLEGTEAQIALALICDVEHQAWIAHGTPYGYFFVVDAMAKLKRTDIILPLLKKLFMPMLERGATCTWETFGGEIHDSLNHAWAATLPYALQRLIAAIDMKGHGYETVIVRPVLSALDQGSLTYALPKGQIELSWQRVDPRHVELSVKHGTALKVVLEINGTKHAMDAQGQVRVEHAFNL